MHNNIMATGLRDRPPVLAIGRYAQWRSRFLRYIDTRSNGDALRKCILEGPYTPSTIIILAVPATKISPAVPERTTVETILNMSPENKDHFETKKEVIHLLLTGIGDEIYSTVDARKTAYKIIAKNANPLTLVAAAQPHQNPYYQAPKSHNSYEPTSKASLQTRSHATTRNKEKQIAKQITPPSELAFEKDNDPEQVQKDKDMRKNLALIAKYFKKLYKPTNNNLRTSLDTKNKNVETTLLGIEDLFNLILLIMGLDKGYDRFQRLLSLLEIHGAGVSTEDANQKFLRSLPSAKSNISLLMRNKPCIDNLDIDDLYKKLKVYEADIKCSFGSSSKSQNAIVLKQKLGNEDLEQTDQDDLEEMDLKWQVVMLSIRVKQFYKKSGRKLEFNGKEPIGFDKTKVECYNCHRRWHFARDCRSARNSGNMSRDAGNAGYRGRDNEEKATDFALMAFPSNPLSSSSSNSELDEALREKEDLKAKLENFETLKNLTKLLDSQINAKVKTGLGYDSQFHEKEMLDIREEEVTETVFDNRSSDEENSLANDRFKKGEGYHAVLPPLTRNYMPPKPDLSFAGLDDSIYKPEPIAAKMDFVKASKYVKHVKPVDFVKHLLDESQVLLRVLRQSNMYSFDLQNVVPSGDLTCLFAKASIDVSNLWHKRLSHVNFKTINKLVKENLVRGLPSKIFENDHTCVACQKVSVENQTGKNAGPQDTNGNVDTQGNVDAGKEVSDQYYIVLPLWSSISSTFKSLDDKALNDKPTDDTDSKTIEEPVNKEDQAYRDELDRLMSQEKEVSDAADSLRHEFKQGCIDQRGVTNFRSTNSFNIISHLVNAASTSRTFSVTRPSSPHPDAFIPASTLLHVDHDDSQILNLEDTAELQSTGIFNSAYDDDLDIFDSLVQSVGVEADFNNMESYTIVAFSHYRDELSIVIYIVDCSFTQAITTTTTTLVSDAQLKALIDQGVARALATRDDGRSRNSKDSHDSGMGVRRQTPPTRECTYPDFMKCQPLNFKGTEGVVELTQWFEKMEIVFRISNCSVENQIKFSTFTLLGSALTWWNSHVMTVSHDVTYTITWADLKKKMTDKYCPMVKMKKLEFELWNLKRVPQDYNTSSAVPCLFIHILCYFLSLYPFTERYAQPYFFSSLIRQTENKRKQDDNNNQAQQQPLKKQGVAIAYTTGPGERKEYAGTQPLCNKCKFHHNGLCTESRNQGHYKSDCPELKNQDHGNQAGGTRAHGMVHALQGGETNQDHNDVEVSFGHYRDALSIVIYIVDCSFTQAFASYMGFIVKQMDVKSAFLYGTIEEEVYVCQPPGFIDPHFPNKVKRVEKALYGLHQAPRAWYETLSTFLLQNGYKRGTINNTLFIKKDKDDIMLVQVYVDDIIFGSTKKSLCDEFEALMHKRFQMSFIGELTFFLGMQVKQSEEGIFISQDKYVVEILKKLDFSSVKTASTPIETQKPLVKDEEAADVDFHLYRSMILSLMYLSASRPDIMFAVCACSRFQVTPKLTYLYAVKRIFRYLKRQPKLGLWYPRDSPFDMEAYSDSDYAGANLDRKSRTGEYVVAAYCCGQVLWIQNQMLDYGFNFMNTKIYIDNENAQTRFEIASKQSHDLPLLEVNTSGSGEESMEHQDDLTDVEPPIPYDSPLSGGHTPGSDEGRVETSTDKSLDEYASKQWRNDDKIEELNLTDGADTEVLVEDKGNGEQGGSTADQVSTARPEVSTATLSTPPTITIFGDEDLTIAQTLIKLRSEEAKEKGVGFRDVKEPLRLTRSTTTLQPLPTIDLKDKELDRAQKERKKQEEATIAALTEEFDEIQAKMDAHHELAVRMTRKEQEKYTIDERARLLAEDFERRKKQLVAKRAEAIWNKPPTRTQVRNMMITYLKHMDDFVPMDSEKEEKKSVEPESKGEKGKRIKRVADSALKQKSSKKQKMMQEQESAKIDEEESANYKHEKEELRMWLTESQILGNVDMEDVHVYKIIKANRNTSYHKSLSSMLRKFDRQDLVDFQRLVMKKFEDNTPEGYNLLLWGDFKSSYIAGRWYFELLQLVSKEKAVRLYGRLGYSVSTSRNLVILLRDAESQKGLKTPHTDEEIDEQELEAHYSYIEKIQEVPTANSGTASEPLEQVQYDAGYNVFTNKIQHFKQSESISNKCVMEMGDSNVILNSPDICGNDI
uniref:Uncharacterized mitochondrial protein AtMg00810-like n=1 Tax=Tanacetum cinerariifolium TaxID=118510 RepID=A0A6L2K6A0_TANCI|nr:uncharacterized mitochondrial protein AtMg00810-like [Tanacetum cinerariifolium]